MRNAGMETKYGKSRIIQEDSTIAVNDETSKSMLFGVLDGHGGKQISRFVSKFFYPVMKRLNSYHTEKFDQALIETYIRMDELLKSEKINNLLKFDEISKISQEAIIEMISSIKNEANLFFDKKDLIEHSGRSISPGKDSPTNIIPHESKKMNYNIKLYNKSIKKDEYLKDVKSKIESPSLIIEEPTLNEINGFSLNPPGNSKYLSIEKKNEKSKEIELENLVAHNMGTTAVIVYIRNRVFYIANAVDSRAVLYKGGKAIRLNEEHKPSLVSEQSRIAKSGFNLISDRIDGKLNLTRAIGK